MSRYIDADSFIDYLGFENTEEAREEIYGEIVTLSDFDNQPTADVEEVKHGQWKSAGCSNCGRTLYELIDGDSYLDSYYEQFGTNFCPHCGAKMDIKE